MDTKTIVKYSTYAVGIVALVLLIAQAPVPAILLAVAIGVDKLYVEKV